MVATCSTSELGRDMILLKKEKTLNQILSKNIDEEIIFQMDRSNLGKTKLTHKMRSFWTYRLKIEGAISVRYKWVFVRK